MNWQSAARTESGKVRACNEDAFLEHPAQGLCVVADGIGGKHRGGFASQLIVSSLARWPIQGSFDQRLKQVSQCLHWVNRRLTRELTIPADRQPDVVASTVVLLMVEGSRAVCLWSGDSRGYLWREQQLYQLSRDHSRQHQLMDEQQLSADQASREPQARSLVHAVGIRDELELSSLEVEVRPNDVFLLCTDGLYQGVSHAQMGQALSLPCAQCGVTRMFAEALQGPADDNLTALVIRR